MVEPPKDLSDQIIAFRDDEPTSAEFRRWLAKDGDALLELADSRLLALALSLLNKGEPDRDDICPPDDQLCLYLLNQVTKVERDRLEERLRGNRSALHRLFKLRSAIVELSTGGDEVPAPWMELVPREDLGVVQFRKSDTGIDFRRQRPLREAKSVVSHVRSRLMDVKEDRLRGPMPRRAIPKPWPPLSKRPPGFSPKIDHDLDELEGHISRLSEFLRHLREVVERSRRKGIGVARELRETSDIEAELQLRQLLEHLPAKLGFRLEEQLRRLAEAARNYLSRLEDDPELVMQELRRFDAAASLSFDLDDAEDEWQALLQLSGPAMTLRLQGRSDAGQTEQRKFSIVVLGIDGNPTSKTLVTIVRKDAGFDTVETDAEGMAMLPLHRGESVLIVGTEPSMQVTLREQDSLVRM